MSPVRDQISVFLLDDHEIVRRGATCSTPKTTSG
jgi:hypothetical protein